MCKKIRPLLTTVVVREIHLTVPFLPRRIIVLRRFFRMKRQKTHRISIYNFSKVVPYFVARGCRRFGDTTWILPDDNFPRNEPIGVTSTRMTMLLRMLIASAPCLVVDAIRAPLLFAEVTLLDHSSRSEEAAEVYLLMVKCFRGDKNTPPC